jgi:hypothetical protein
MAGKEPFYGVRIPDVLMGSIDRWAKAIRRRDRIPPRFGPAVSSFHR